MKKKDLNLLIANTIRKICKDRNISLFEASFSYYSEGKGSRYFMKIVSGKANISIKKLEQILDYFKMDVVEFFSYLDDETK